MSLGWSQLAAVSAVLIVLGAIGVMALWPYLYSEYARQVCVPRFEASYGFRGGSISSSAGTATDATRMWGVIAVEPGGRFERAGVRVGDVPIGYHGGPQALCDALSEGQGRRTTFEVLNIGDWNEGRKAARVIILEGG
jgi:hypothetical protein